jgi:hypothetical protein
MILTNKFNLPKAFELAVANDDYSPGDAHVSVTGLLQPPRIRALYEVYKNEVTEDVSDRIWSLLGTALHVILERAGEGAGDTLEERLYTGCGGWVVSGKFDSLRAKDGTLTDFKSTSSWNRVFNSRMADWTTQLNLYAALCRRNDRGPINRLTVCALYRDWMASKAADGRGYPQTSVEEIEVDVWPQDECMAVMEELVHKHQVAKEHLPLCTDEQRWKDKRTGKYRRCEQYCNVAPHCTQFQEEKTNVG